MMVLGKTFIKKLIFKMVFGENRLSWNNFKDGFT